VKISLLFDHPFVRRPRSRHLALADSPFVVGFAILSPDSALAVLYDVNVDGGRERGQTRHDHDDEDEDEDDEKRLQPRARVQRMRSTTTRRRRRRDILLCRNGRLELAWARGRAGGRTRGRARGTSAERGIQASRSLEADYRSPDIEIELGGKKSPPRVSKWLNVRDATHSIRGESLNGREEGEKWPFKGEDGLESDEKASKWRDWTLSTFGAKGEGGFQRWY